MNKIGFGLGTGTGNGNDIKIIIQNAYDNGYKSFDTAQMYKNESLVGEVLEGKSDVSITTKISVENILAQKTRESFFVSYEKIKKEVIDLVLLHGNCGNELNLLAYKELIKLKEEGYIKNIGVSNFSVDNLLYLISNTKIVPYCNQINLSLSTRGIDIENFCKENNIKLFGYSLVSLFINRENFSFFQKTPLSQSDVDEVMTICNKYKVSINQLLNKWALQLGYYIIPKSSKVTRMKENINLDFKINEEDMSYLNSLNNLKDNEMSELINFSVNS